MQVQEMMTSNPASVTPEDTAQDAARLMKASNCGSLPVVDNQRSMRLVGVVTDRDLAIRGLADGKGADTKISELMSRDPSCCSPDTDVSELERIMAERQVRRVPVLDSTGRCVGIVSQADLALSKGGVVTDREIAVTVERISESTHSPRSAAEVGLRPDL